MFDDSTLKLNGIPNGVFVDTYIPSPDTDATDNELLEMVEFIKKHLA
jgi:hypothetical protein